MIIGAATCSAHPPLAPDLAQSPLRLPAHGVEQDAVPPGRPGDVVGVRFRLLETGAQRRERFGHQTFVHLDDVEDGAVRVDALEILDDVGDCLRPRWSMTERRKGCASASG
jgi:hypothetical protein